MSAQARVAPEVDPFRDSLHDQIVVGGKALTSRHSTEECGFGTVAYRLDSCSRFRRVRESAAVQPRVRDLMDDRGGDVNRLRLRAQDEILVETDEPGVLLPNPVISPELEQEDTVDVSASSVQMPRSECPQEREGVSELRIEDGTLRRVSGQHPYVDALPTVARRHAKEEAPRRPANG